MRWFMDQVDKEIHTSRAWMRLRPELVEIIHGLRQEYMGAVLDGTTKDHPEALMTDAGPRGNPGPS
ncbi:hypothetical protein ACFY94_25050 [Streptomyces griseorubiginosus]|uniref:hypothetical protein n=1 Tax=Streptomyces griseorubiginosus TaxID=67304 RepID=UPI0036DFBB40